MIKELLFYQIKAVLFSRDHNVVVRGRLFHEHTAAGDTGDTYITTPHTKEYNYGTTHSLNF